MSIIRSIYLLLFSGLLLISCSKDQPVVLQGYIEGKFIYISSAAGGMLKSLVIQRGDLVKANQPLYSLDPEPEQSELKNAAAKLVQEKENLQNVIRGQRQTVLDSIIAQREQASADLIYSEQKLSRYQKLFAEGAIAKNDLDQANSDYEAKKQAVKQYEANLADAKLGEREHLIFAQQAAVSAAAATVAQFSWQLGQKTIAAPKQGVIFDTFFKVGEYVPAEQAVTALLTPDNVKLIFYVPEPLLGRLKVGGTVTFKCDGCQPQQQATISYISSQAEFTPPVIYSQKTRANLVYRVEARLPEKEAVQLHAGQPVDVTIEEHKE